MTARKINPSPIMLSQRRRTDHSLGAVSHNPSQMAKPQVGALMEWT